MEDDEPPDPKPKNYGICVFVTGAHITPVNNQQEDSIHFHKRDYPYAVIEGYRIGLIPPPRALKSTTKECCPVLMISRISFS